MAEAAQVGDVEKKTHVTTMHSDVDFSAYDVINVSARSHAVAKQGECAE